MVETIDAHLPEYHFSQRCSRVVPAPREAVWTALTRVSMNDLRLTRALMSVRHFGKTPPPAPPIFTHGPLTLLHIDEGRIALAGKVTKPWKLVPMDHAVGTLDDFDEFNQPGWVKFLTSFELTEVPGGVELATETRGVCTDSRSRRQFAIYWRAIRPFAELVRRDILATTATRAVAASKAAA